MRPITILAAILLATSCTNTNMSSTASPKPNPAAPAANPAQPLDGKVFDIVLVEPNGEKKGPDQLVFDAGSFESTACRPYGFTPARYSAGAGADGTRFDATAKSKDSGTNSWKGDVRGPTVRGSMTWSNPKGEAVTYTFEGKAASGALDGRTYRVQLVGADGKNQDKDDLSFTDGSFDSSACRSFGFIRTGYTTTAEGDAIRFDAVAASADYGTNRWQGTIRGDRIEGTLQPTDPSGQAPAMRFSGVRIR